MPAFNRSLLSIALKQMLVQNKMLAKQVYSPKWFRSPQLMNGRHREKFSVNKKHDHGTNSAHCRRKGTPGHGSVNQVPQKSVGVLALFNANIPAS